MSETFVCSRCSVQQLYCYDVFVISLQYMNSCSCCKITHCLNFAAKIVSCTRIPGKKLVSSYLLIILFCSPLVDSSELRALSETSLPHKSRDRLLFYTHILLLLLYNLLEARKGRRRSTDNQGGVIVQTSAEVADFFVWKPRPLHDVVVEWLITMDQYF